MNKRLIVSDASRARIFKCMHLGELTELQDLIHAESRLKNRELVGDASGKSVDQHGSLEPATAPKAHEEQMFAKLLAQHLKDMHNQEHYEELILVAPPKFLGLLRAELHEPLGKMVEKTIDKDLTQLNTQELQDYLTK